MAIYHVEVYETCSTTYKVEAADEAEAIHQALHAGDLECVGSAQQFIETDMDRGLPVNDGYSGDPARLDELDLIEDEWIRGIRSIELVEADREKTETG